MVFILQTHLSKVSRKICWKHGTSPKINSFTDAWIIICRTFSNNSGSYFNGQLMLRKLTDLNFKWRELIKWCQGDISVWILRTVLYPPAAAHSDSQASKVDLITRMVNCFKLMLLTVLAKSSIVDFWRGP